MKTLGSAAIAFTLAVRVAAAQGVEFVKANYTKYEFQIPMRDSKKLFTSVYVPKDDSERWPIMLDRTPYSVAPYGIDNYRAALGPNEKFAKEKFIFRLPGRPRAQYERG